MPLAWNLCAILRDWDTQPLALLTLLEEEQRRCDKADRLFEKLVKGTDFERLDGYHALRHSFI
jgi:hypothetical protein